MPLRTYFADNPPPGWDQLTDNSIFASPLFARLCRHLGGKEIFLVDEKNGQTTAGICGVMFGRKFLRRYQSMPDGLSGGAFTRTNLSTDQRLQFADQLAEWLKAMGVIRADIHNPPYSLKSKYFLKRAMSTHIIYLDRGEYKIPDKKIMEHLRTGDRRGALVTEFDDEDKLDQFYELVIKTYRRHNRPPRYSREFFSELFNLAQKDNRVHWLAARLKERLIGTRICIREKDNILLWQYFSDYEYQQYKPGYLLIDHIIKYALDHGVRSINMGGSPEEAAGLIDYKERWGGIKTDLPYYTFFGGLGKLLYRWER